MTNEFKEEKKNSKSDKDLDRVDKELLSKAKNSRDMIDRELRRFENSIEDISHEVKKGTEKKSIE